MDYRELLNSLEKICVLVAITFLAGRSDAFARIVSRVSKPSDRLLMFGFFSLLALTEVLLVPERTPLDARIISATAAGLLGGIWVGVGVGAVTGAAGALMLGPQAGLDGLPAVIGGALGGWISGFRSELGPRLAAGFLAGALSHGVWLAVRYWNHIDVDTWGAIAIAHVLPMSVSGVGVSLFLILAADMRAHRERIERQAQAVSRAELKALQAQVHPHFLFNALNTIAAMCEIEPRKAAALTVKLGEFFRSSFRSDTDLLSSLQEELAAIRSYLEIERARFGDRLEVVEEIDPGSDRCRLPSFALQPIVENAVLHGISMKPGKGKLRIATRVKNSRLVCWVLDNGCGFDASAGDWRKSESHALSMLERRLEKLYDGRCGLRVRSQPGKGTVVCLWVPVTEKTN